MLSKDIRISFSKSSKNVKRILLVGIPFKRDLQIFSKQIFATVGKTKRIAVKPTDSTIVPIQPETAAAIVKLARQTTR